MRAALRWRRARSSPFCIAWAAGGRPRGARRCSLARGVAGRCSHEVASAVVARRRLGAAGQLLGGAGFEAQLTGATQAWALSDGVCQCACRGALRAIERGGGVPRGGRGGVRGQRRHDRVYRLGLAACMLRRRAVVGPCTIWGCRPASLLGGAGGANIFYDRALDGHGVVDASTIRRNGQAWCSTGLGQDEECLVEKYLAPGSVCSQRRCPPLRPLSSRAHVTM